MDVFNKTIEYVENWTRAFGRRNGNDKRGETYQKLWDENKSTAKAEKMPPNDFISFNKYLGPFSIAWKAQQNTPKAAKKVVSMVVMKQRDHHFETMRTQGNTG